MYPYCAYVVSEKYGETGNDMLERIGEMHGREVISVLMARASGISVILNLIHSRRH